LGLLTDYPAWFILFCLFLGVVYAFFLYFRSDKESTAPWLRMLLAFLRFTAVFLISFLLLSPLIRSRLTTIEKPIIVIGQDNSQSLVLSPDSAFTRGEYLGQLHELINQLSSTYEVRTYSFGERVTSPMDSGFNEKRTDIGRFFKEISSIYENRNLGAIILASDGIWNFGTDPYYAAKDLAYPVYTVVLGDTSVRRDLKIAQVGFNQNVFLGDDFPVEIQVDATHCDREDATLTVMENGKIVASSQIQIRGSRFSRLIQLMLDAKESGWHRYSIRLTPVGQEVTWENNRQDIFIEVMNRRTNVMIVQESPHPDIGALRGALGHNDKYEVVIKTPEEFLLSDDTADLTIFYQVPSRLGIRIAASKVAQLPSALFVLGSQSDITAFNKLNTGMNLAVSSESYTESYPSINDAFPYFTISQSLTKLMPQWSPLQCPFASFQLSSMTEVLTYQRINGITTQFPLISFVQTADRKRGFITGENFWRWRITDFVQAGDHQTFDELIQKIVQYLSVKQDKSFFRISLKSEYLENEIVEIHAELYNKSYELINKPDASLVITHEQGDSYPYSFGQTGSIYYLRAGTFSPGVYTYAASVTNGPDHYEKKGAFVVTSLNLEAIDLQANQSALFRIAESHRGKLLHPDELNQLPELLKHNMEIHSIAYEQKNYSELIGSVWMFLLILGLLTAEWALRKYSGI